jgi:hypothetical protein
VQPLRSPPPLADLASRRSALDLWRPQKQNLRGSVGRIFQDIRKALTVWFRAMWAVTNQNERS